MLRARRADPVATATRPAETMASIGLDGLVVGAEAIEDRGAFTSPPLAARVAEVLAQLDSRARAAGERLVARKTQGGLEAEGLQLIQEAVVIHGRDVDISDRRVLELNEGFDVLEALVGELEVMLRDREE